MLFTSLLFKILTKEKKKTGIKICGYVNDGLLTTKASKEVTSATKIKKTFAKIKTLAI